MKCFSILYVLLVQFCSKFSLKYFMKYFTGIFRAMWDLQKEKGNIPLKVAELLQVTLYRRPSWKSRPVDFSLEKATRRFFVGKADKSIFGPKSGHVDFSWKRAQFGPEFKLLLFKLRPTDTGKSSDSLCTLFICIFWYRFFNYTFIKLIFFNREKNSGPMCPLFQQKIDVSAFPTKNWRVGFSNGKSTCRLFQRKIDVSTFPAENRRVNFFH